MLLCIMIFTYLPSAPTATAASSDSSTIRMTLSKDAYWYKPGATVRLNVTLINLTDKELENVSIRVKVHAPDNYRSDMDNTLKKKPVKNYRINKILERNDVLEPGDNKYKLNLSIPSTWFSDGVYPLTVEAIKSNKVETSEVTQLIIMSGLEPEKQVPLKLVTVFDMAETPNRNPNGLFSSTSLAKECSRNKDNCWITTVIEELTKRENYKCAVAMSPLLLEEMEDMSNGFSVETKEGDKEYKNDSNESSFTANAISELGAIALDPRFQFLDTPYAYPDLEKLSQMGWVEDSSSQIEQGRDLSSEILKTDISEDYFFPPMMMINSTTLEELEDDIGRYLVISPKVLERNDKGKRLEKGLTLSNPVDIEVGEDKAGATAIFSDRRLEELIARVQSSEDSHGVTQLILAELTNLFLERPAMTRSCVMLWPSWWRPTTAVTSEVISAISNAPWLQTSTLEECFAEVEPLEDVSYEIPEPQTGPGSYYTDVGKARNSYIDFSNVTFPDNPYIKLLTQDLFISESSLWEESDSIAEGLKYADYVKSTVSEELKKIVIPVSPTITLTSGEGDIPISVVNGTGYQVKTVLRFQSNGLSFPDGSVLETVLEPKENFFEVSVKAEKDGRVPLSATLEGQDFIIDHATFSVLTSTFNSFAMALVGGLLGLIALIWIAKYYTKRRVGKHKKRQLKEGEREETQ